MVGAQPFTVVLTAPRYVSAGTHGFNAIKRNCDPMDDHNHGTHVSGTIGAAGNNALGVVGVNWVASVMGLKFLDSSGSGTVADAIAAIEFAIQTKQAFAAKGSANIRVLSKDGVRQFSQACAIRSGRPIIKSVVAAGGNRDSRKTLSIIPSYQAPNVMRGATTSTTPRLIRTMGRAVHLGPARHLQRQRGHLQFVGGTWAAPHVRRGRTGASHRALETAVSNSRFFEAVLPCVVDYNGRPVN